MSLLALSNRLRRQRGVISVLTLAFMVLAGMSLLVTLWGIARVTGAFNTLYTANESASFAALSASESFDDKIKVKCQNLTSENPSEPPTICRKQAAGLNKHPALDAAEAVMKRSLQSRPFGLCYDGMPGASSCNGNGEVRLVAAYTDSPSWTPAIKVFNMGQALNRLQCRGPGGVAAIPSGRDMISDNSSGQIICWGLREYGQAFQPNFNTGVITRAQAEVEFVPGCLNASLCPTTEIRVASAATQDQPLPGTSYWSP